MRRILLMVMILAIALITSCGKTSSGKKDTGNTGNPFGDKPVREIKVGDLTLYEGRMYISLDTEKNCLLHMPVKLDDGSAAISPVVTVSTTDYDGKIQAGLSASANTEVTAAAQEITVTMGNSCLPDIDMASNLVLNYGISWNKQEINGTVSFFYIMPRIKSQILGTSVLLEGDVTKYKILVTDKQSEKPLSGVNVTLKAALGDETAAEGYGTTDEFGNVSIELALPSEKDGALSLITSVQTPLGEQQIEAMASLQRHEKIMLTTDKPIYQPGQEIYIRSLSLKVPHKTPMADRDVTLEILDAKGNKVFKQTGKTSKYGVYSAKFKLAKLVNTGKYTINAVVGTQGEVVEKKTITVDNYVLPKFNINFDSDSNFYMPGGHVTGKIKSGYFYGKPVSGGKVHVSAKKFDISFSEFATIDSVLDANGEYILDLDLPTYFTGSELEQGNALVMLEISVTDNASHTQTANKSLKIVSSPVLINLVPESGRLLPGVPQKFYLTISDPSGKPLAGICNIKTAAGDMEITVPVAGISVFEYAAAENELSITVSALAEGQSTEKVFNFTQDTTAEFVMVGALSTIYKVGETMNVFVIASARPGTAAPLIPERAYLDVIQNGQTRLMTIVELKEGKGTAEITLDETMTGPVELFAYYLTSEGNIIRDSKLVFVRKTSNLNISMIADKEVYKPREKAKVTFSVSDLKGDPAEAALGISMVDEAVFAVQEFMPGMEQTYFDLEQNIMNPSYEIHGISYGDITSKEPDTKEGVEELDERAAAFFAQSGGKEAYGVTADTYSAKEKKYRSSAAQAVSTKVETILKKFKKTVDNGDCRNADIKTSQIQDEFEKSTGTDPWKNIMAVDFKPDYSSYMAIVKSAGPDEVKDTADDVVINYNLCDNFWGDEADKGAGGSDVASVSDSGTNGIADSDSNVTENNDSDPGAHGSQAAVRRWFPETLLFNPELVTGQDGTATVNVTMPDSITTWRVTTLASTLGGSLGSKLDGITVFQDFFVDIDFPVSLTQNDTVSVPVGIYNYLSESQTVTLTAEPAEWFEMSGSAVISVEVAANSVQAVYFPIKVLKAGEHSLTVYAKGTQLEDAIKRTVKVIPDGLEKTASKSDILDKSVNITLDIPENSIADSQELFVKVYPGVMAQAVEGLDSILQMPNGCFEQTSSSTYPNVLVLQYMEKIKKITPEIELKALDYIAQGYQRLLTYEVDGGGFEWFGEKPAHFVLTCYGMMEFVDMAQVYQIDDDLIPRTAQWMVSQQDANGSFVPSTGGIAEGAITNFEGSVIRTTAYGVWALARAQQQTAAVKKGAAYLKSHLADAKDNYSKAITAIALVSAGEDSVPEVEAFISQILQDKKEDGKGGYYWDQTEKTETYSSGDNAKLETTSLIGLLLIERGSDPAVVQGILSWLTRQKDSFGNWSTTQGTVLALRLMIATLGIDSPDVSATITVSANGGEPFDIAVDSTNSDVMRLIDLKSFIKAGQNEVNITFSGTGQMMYSAVAQWYEPGKQASTGSGPLSITVTYDKTKLEVNDTVGVTVAIKNNTDANISVILASVGIAPGFTLDTSKLDALVAKKSFLQKYETTPRQVILYIKELKGKGELSINYDLVAKFPMKASTGESSVNPYYNPEQKNSAGGTEIEVAE